jgi:hypothetical protein
MPLVLRGRVVMGHSFLCIRYRNDYDTKEIIMSPAKRCVKKHAKARQLDEFRHIRSGVWNFTRNRARPPEWLKIDADRKFKRPFWCHDPGGRMRLLIPKVINCPNCHN